MLRPDEPLTDQRRKDFAALTLNVPPRPIEPDWAAFVDHRIKLGTLFAREEGIDADWRTWVRRGNRFAAKDRAGARSERQPLGNTNHWLKTGSENDL